MPCLERQNPAKMVSLTGRRCAPYPDKRMTDRNAMRLIREADAWLINEAIAEAVARRDDFNETHFRSELPIQKHGLPPASRDMAHLYLFGVEQVHFDRSL